VKKRLLMFFIICVMSLSFAAPAMAATTFPTQTICETSGQESSTEETEMTQIYHRWYEGRLQFRVWSITYGRWLTEWTDM